MIIRLMGGLGNQMFQYAMGKAAANERNEKLFLDKFSYYRDKKRKCEIEKFNVKSEKLSVWKVLYYNMFFWEDRKNRNGNKIFWEKKIFEYEITRNIPLKYFVGSWQNEKYFKTFRDELRDDFTFKERFREEIEEKTKSISQENSVAVHVRRGDYLENSEYVVQRDNYYIKAMQYIWEREKNVKFYVFSDDIGWCKKHFDKEKDIICISGNTDLEDFFLMSQCRHFIIANSSFSWWAAWLADTNAIKIAPANWFVNENINKKVEEALLEEFYILKD